MFLFLYSLHPKVILKNNSGTYLVDKRLVLARLLAYTTIKNSFMGKHRCEAFVVKLERNIWHLLAPLCRKLTHTLQVLAWLTI